MKKSLLLMCAGLLLSLPACECCKRIKDWCGRCTKKERHHKHCNECPEQRHHMHHHGDSRMMVDEE